jgi:type II secretory pathway pseudopilin PulG
MRTGRMILEMIVCVTILAICFAAIFPQFEEISTRAKNTVAAAQFRSLEKNILYKQITGEDVADILNGEEFQKLLNSDAYNIEETQLVFCGTDGVFGTCDDLKIDLEEAGISGFK